MKKLISVLLLLAMFTAIFSGCSKDADTPPSTGSRETAPIETTTAAVYSENLQETSVATEPQHVETTDETETEKTEPALPETTQTPETEPVQETETESGSEHPDVSTSLPSPEEIDWAHTTIRVDGVAYSTMMPYEELQESGWDFDFADYNIGENYVLNPGDWSAATIHLNNPEKYGKDISSAEIVVGFMNYSDDILPIKECCVRAIKVDGTYNFKLIDEDWKAPCYEFEFILGIKRGDTEEKILAAYGIPTDISENEDAGYKIYTYMSSDGTVENKLTIYAKYGLQAVEITDRNRY